MLASILGINWNHAIPIKNNDGSSVISKHKADGTALLIFGNDRWDKN